MRNEIKLKPCPFCGADAALYVDVGETVDIPDFDPDRWKECTTGIHHFITRAEAVIY